MRRRDFIKGIAGSATAWPLAARAQQPERLRQIGVLISTREDDPDGQARAALLRQGLSELGWTEGRNIHIDYRWVGGDEARAKANAAELVSQKPDVIVANSTLALAAVHKETTAIPVVFVVVGDPVGQGFVTSLARPSRGAAAAWPLGARAQTGGKRPLIVFLNSGRRESNAPNISAFLESMRALGYVEGESFDVAYRFANENNARLSTLAREVVELKPNAIVAGQTSAALAAQKATQSLPIICALLVEPVGMGLVANYAHPGSNVTGTLVAVEDLSKKQLEIIVELLPDATTIGLLVNPTNPAMQPQQQEIESAARTKGIKIVAAEAGSEADIEPALKSLIAVGVQAVIVTRDALFFNERRRVAELAATFRLPTGHGEKLEVQAGGLVSYGVDVPANYGRAAYFVDKVLKGAKPADLPVEFPTKLEMAINLKTAKALGLTVPQSLRATADDVIE